MTEEIKPYWHIHHGILAELLKDWLPYFIRALSVEEIAKFVKGEK